MEGKKTILLTGGGTLGPVTPLLALAETWKRMHPSTQFLWVGTPDGPERALVERANIPFHPFASPKFSRHQLWKLPWIPFALLGSVIRARQLLEDLKPDMIFSAGGYVSVPFAWVGKMEQIPVWIHQLDLLPLLANKLMAPFARQISVTWEASMQNFPLSKTSYAGSLVRPELLRGDKRKFEAAHGLRAHLPTVLVMGGGTGAQSLNEAVEVIREDVLTKANIIHLVGRGKMTAALEKPAKGYVASELLDEKLADAFATADVVVARAGMGTLMELAALGKPTILVPIADSEHQVANAKAAEEKEAAVVLINPTPQLLRQNIYHLLENGVGRGRLSHAIKNLFETNAASRIIQKAVEILS